MCPPDPPDPTPPLLHYHNSCPAKLNWEEGGGLGKGVLNLCSFPPKTVLTTGRGGVGVWGVGEVETKEVKSNLTNPTFVIQLY